MSLETELQNYWMPFTANRAFKKNPRLITSAEGIHLFDPSGRRILDGSSGLFCVPAGHCRPEIAKAVGEQLRKLDYTSPFQFSHPGGFELARKIAELTPPGLDRIFFANSGSESVETAMKMAIAYHRANGQPQRYRFVSRELAYHGVNFGGISVGGMIKNREGYGPLLPGVVHMRHTQTVKNSFTQGQAETGADLADDLQRAVDFYGADTIAAVVVEPVVGSVGILVPPKGYLQRLRQIADKHGILLIFDEVITGFGRTGAPFAAQTFDVQPDLITMAKALTNGSIPMGAVAASTKIYDTITSAAPDDVIEFFHGYTYSAHPVATAAGLATLRIYEEDGLYQRAADLAGPFQAAVAQLRELSMVTDIRGYGLLAGIDLEPTAKFGQRGYAMLKALFEAGLLVRVTNDTVILAPPFVAEVSDLEQMVDIIKRTISQL
ncbi:aminotransferase class III-fold pyridoxal phosphate-dependent enzyme [Blastopirellula sp. JC732]|uniref:Aminotransferase class III-fold pyridoxal phosphate-dependent enzyme n=1 Tax=Blastopirellula sediminis TaxID=2894196 RepID=A0A9X1MNV9_9BACT|nr:aminotransferase class III-fold pyridoxal phosphate-dependent enzyme [Blastopirellula sediminis]MCC9608298.1 aminotransferase class III-fold pyridoxal phosphate-dependent enzyme [Blastopirellula sediminis]MCC9628924.1 aminotransferase class III-fold pyridoxal phosphate-dependent enzyme [Blastopirellula sediminis]